MTGVHLRWLSTRGLRVEAAELLPLLTDVERGRYADTVDPGRAERFVLGRVLVRVLAAELAGVPTASVRVSACCAECGGPHGRPVVSGSDRLDRLAVSIAHCPDAVVVAASADGPVGVDVEPASGSVERLRAITEVAGAPFSDVRVADPVLHWTRVEAALKADGRGLTVDPRRVRVHEFRGAAEARIEAPGQPLGRRFRLAEPQLDSTLRVSVAVGTSSRAGVTLGWRRERDLVGAVEQ